ncbi:MAG: nucleotide-binding protein [Methanomicrobium sp.]|nr:nucleotide-binding protein [Methanomicrobium sp.]
MSESDEKGRSAGGDSAAGAADEHADEQVKVLDSSFFFLDIPIAGTKFAVPPSVVAEMKDLRSKSKLDAMLGDGRLFVSEASPATRKRVIAASKKSGDYGVISDTDCDVVALALEMGGIVVTDDFALSNTAQTLGLTVIPVQMRKAKKRQWKYRCTGCLKLCDAPGICDVCGSEIIRIK